MNRGILQAPRHNSISVPVGPYRIGGGAPILVQSMTNTDTEDAEGTAAQVRSLAEAGSELVRITVNTPAAAAAVPHIRERLDAMDCGVPLIGDFQYNGQKLLRAPPACAAALAPAAERGRVLGVGQGGVVIGLLLARAATGVIADAWGWRAVYAVSAVISVPMLAALWRWLPAPAMAAASWNGTRNSG